MLKTPKKGPFKASAFPGNFREFSGFNEECFKTAKSPKIPGKADALKEDYQLKKALKTVKMTCFQA